MAEPLSLEDAKAQLRILDDSEDAVILSAIEDARGWIEAYTGLVLTRRTVTEAIASFDDRLRTWPIVSIDSVDYVDSDGLPAFMSAPAYSTQISRRPARLLARSWPRVYGGAAIEVTMTAGFASAEAVKLFSPNLMRTMRLLVAAYYNDRETGGLAGDVEESAKRLCRPFKRWCA